MQRALLLVHRHAALGHGPREKNRLAGRLGKALGTIELKTRLCADHDAVRDAAHAFAADPTPGVLVTGGGGGTLRAAAEGLLGTSHVALAPLRLGSGNLVARHLGVPEDPEHGIEAIAEAILAGRTTRLAPVGVCLDGGPVRLALGLVGLGQLGRVPGDLARLHETLPRTRRTLARLAGMERLTYLEYGVCLAARAGRAALARRRAECVDVTTAGRTRRLSLLAGALTPIPGLLPLLDDRLCLVAFDGPAVRHALPLDLELVGDEGATLFLDEDPLEFTHRVSLRREAPLTFVSPS